MINQTDENIDRLTDRQIDKGTGRILSDYFITKATYFCNLIRVFYFNFVTEQSYKTKFSCRQTLSALFKLVLSTSLLVEIS